MTTPRVQSFQSLRDEMIAVARGERPAPAHAAAPSVHSADVIARLLTPENRALMAAIRDTRPDSVAELAAHTRRAASNLTRTLDKLAAVGLVFFQSIGRQKAPRVTSEKILIEIDPFSLADRVRVVKARRAAAKRGLKGAKGLKGVKGASRKAAKPRPRATTSTRP